MLRYVENDGAFRFENVYNGFRLELKETIFRRFLQCLGVVAMKSLVEHQFMIESVASIDKLLFGSRKPRDPQLKVAELLQELIVTRRITH